MANVIDFGIRIRQQMTGDDAVSKLAGIEKQIGKSTTSISAMEVKLGTARRALAALMDGGGSGKSSSLAAVDKMRDSIARLEGDLAKKRGGLGDMMGGLGDAKGAAGLQTSLQEIGELGGPIAAVTVVVLGLVLAIGILTVSLARFALESANAERTLRTVMSAMTGSTGAADANIAAIDRVADSTALARGQIEEIGKRLATAGIDGQRFENTLSSISLATALLGASAGSHLETIIERSKALGHFQFSDRQLKGLGISFGDLAAQVGMTEAKFKAAMKAGQVSVETGVDAINAAIAKRFGGGGAALMLDFNVQLVKLHDHLVGLTRDVNIEPFLIAMKDLLSVFDRNTVTGEALHFVFTKVFDGLFAAASAAEPYVKAFFQGIVIAALVTYIAIVQVKRALEEAFGGTALEGIDGMSLAINLGIAAFSALVAIVLLLVGAVLILAGAILLPFLPFLLLIIATYYGFQLASDACDAFTESASGIELPDLGQKGMDMIAGLLASIGNGSSLFESAMKALGEAGMNGLNSIFHFGSPSRAMIQRGQWIDEGGAQGVSGGAMARAMGGMASPADVKAPAAAKGAGSTVYITIDARGADKGMVDYMIDKLGDAFEGAAILVGAGPAPEPT